MSRTIAHLLAIAALMLPSLVRAEPTKLKLSFFTSDRSVAYQAAVKPFVEAINREGKALLQVDVYLSGTLGKVQKELPQLVLDGGTDIAFIVPGQNPERFKDNAAIELPGLFQDAREATLVHTRLASIGALAGYEDFFVIGAYGTDPETVHSRKSLTTLEGLKGQKIRTNNLTESTGLAALGALPVVLAFNETTPAISSGTIDGATAPTVQLFDVGIGRLTSNHYLVPTSTAPLALVMSRKVFDRLPDEAKTLVRKYSGEWSAARFIEAYEKLSDDVLSQLRADPRRQVTVPSSADAKAAQAAFSLIRKDWAAASPHNHELLAQAQVELQKLRTDK